MAVECESECDPADDPTPEGKLGELRERLEAVFYWMDEVGATFHPLWAEDILRMAELLRIDTSTVPTEGRALHR